MKNLTSFLLLIFLVINCCYAHEAKGVIHNLTPFTFKLVESNSFRGSLVSPPDDLLTSNNSTVFSVKSENNFSKDVIKYTFVYQTGDIDWCPPSQTRFIETGYSVSGTYEYDFGSNYCQQTGIYCKNGKNITVTIQNCDKSWGTSKPTFMINFEQ